MVKNETLSWMLENLSEFKKWLLKSNAEPTTKNNR